MQNLFRGSLGCIEVTVIASQPRLNDKDSKDISENNFCTN